MEAAMTPVTEYAYNGDVSIAYETFGDPSGDPLLMFMGLDFQMLWWPDEFCLALADRGFFVARFDNRDTGLSTHFSSARRENALRAQLGLSKPAYTASDMVDDAIAVMDALGWATANILGGSMGAALAQGLVLLHPERAKSLISMMGMPATVSSVGSLKYIHMGILTKLVKIKPAQDRDGEIEMLTSIYRLIASPGYPIPEQWARDVAGRCYDRSPRDPQSTQRQLSATRAQKYPPLSTIDVPTLVISGESDPIIKVKAGRDTAAQIPGAKFVSYPGMGHNVPQELWPQAIAEICDIAVPAAER
jgi:pimeloyl-ACP methyl ester carboxylesterase